jgi:glycosyltransferase involved in cell wall biosynthesis
VIEASAEPPLVSVVIPSVNGMPVLAECVHSFVTQEASRPAEVLVVDRCGEDIRREIRERFPRVRVLAAESRTSIPALRKIGMAHAQGQMIAFTEDHCLAAPGWLRAVEEAWQAGCRAVGGPVENGSATRLVDWAVFFCEYVRFMGPVPRGTVGEIAGNNSAYARGLLERLRPEMEAEVWETFLHARMRELGVTFHSVPEMAVLHKKSFGFGYFLLQRYHYARSFAGMRLSKASPWRRGLYAAATTLLPGLLLGRIAAAVARKRRHFGTLLCSLPVLSTFLLSWAWGEGVGALFGPGQSLQRVE